LTDQHHDLTFTVGQWKSLGDAQQRRSGCATASLCRLNGSRRIGQRCTLEILAAVHQRRVGPSRPSRRSNHPSARNPLIMTGTVIGSMLGLPGNGRRISLRTMHVFEFRDGLSAMRTSGWTPAATIPGPECLVLNLNSAAERILRAEDGLYHRHAVSPRRARIPAMNSVARCTVHRSTAPSVPSGHGFITLPARSLTRHSHAALAA
jgi:hypothetical protein